MIDYYNSIIINIDVESENLNEKELVKLIELVDNVKPTNNII